ncbi:M23 family metallopeptidase [Flammeovirgaceae bacterium SG7u.111]|nr:M23 family metallopeptidase [Flammeovirgaceae bacterium SG7u.111]
MAQTEKYIFPIRPGVQNYLSGSMGEIRSNHFHAGFDIKTQGQENLPVYAVADGYVYRIKISPTGYGRVLYVQHTNGRRSVYAHLNKFRKDMEDFVLQKQYEEESFSIELFPNANQFGVRKGEEIALSGNTGSSGGPHLHFEIRQNNDVALNPAKYGFSEIKDKVSPVAYRVALKTFSMDARLNGKMGRIERKVVRSGNMYKASGVIDAVGLLGVEFQGVDRANETSNTYGINMVKVELDRKLIYHHEIEGIPFELTQYINLFTDYYQWGEHRKIFQKCYQDLGNKLPFYEESPTNGFFKIEADGKLHELKIFLIDSYGNTTPILIQLRGNESSTVQKGALVTELESGVRQKHFVWYADSLSQIVNVGGLEYEIKPNYKSEKGYLYAWDLRQGLPDSLLLSDSLETTDLLHGFLPKKSTSFYNELADVHIPADALSDTLYLTLGIKNKRLQIAEYYTPIFERIKIDFHVPDSLPHEEKYHVYRIGKRNKPSFIGGNWEGATVSFSTRGLGEFELLADSIPPTIRVISRSRQYVRCIISDRLSGIDSYRATINGKWVMMEYDPRKAVIWTKLMESSDSLKGDFKLEVTDKAGNKKVYQTRL